MKLLKIFGGILVPVLFVVACKKEDTSISNQLNEADNGFVLFAGTTNSAATQTAKAALSKSADSIVLSFAQQILSEYTKAQSDLKIMGTVVGFSVKDTIDAAHIKFITQLNTLTGRTFDSVYMHTQLLDFQSMITAYSSELENGRQTNVQAYAKTNLENIKINYLRADSIARAFY